MASPASIKDHPIHPMLVALPLGLWTFALVCDFARIAGGGHAWSTVALYCTAGGIVSAVLAAVPGLIDYFSIDEAEMKEIATTHLICGVGSVAIFTLNLWSRYRLADGSAIPLMLSIAGVLIALFGGWLGGEMVYRKGMAVAAVEELSQQVAKQGKDKAKDRTLRRAG